MAECSGCGHGVAHHNQLGCFYPGTPGVGFETGDVCSCDQWRRGPDA